MVSQVCSDFIQTFLFTVKEGTEGRNKTRKRGKEPPARIKALTENAWKKKERKS